MEGQKYDLSAEIEVYLHSVWSRRQFVSRRQSRSLELRARDPLMKINKQIMELNACMLTIKDINRIGLIFLFTSFKIAEERIYFGRTYI